MLTREVAFCAILWHWTMILLRGGPISYRITILRYSIDLKVSKICILSFPVVEEVMPYGFVFVPETSRNPYTSKGTLNGKTF